MTTIYIIRHGETDWNAAGRLQGRVDIPLNNRGIGQAKECRDYLTQFDWDVVISSPLKRARQTAEIINEALQLPLVLMEEFQEKFFGDAEGMTSEERKVIFPNRSYTNQENSTDFHNRLLAGLTRINEKFAGKRVVLVAHGAVIHELFDLLSEEALELHTPLLNACMNHIQYEQDKWVIKDFNIISHLSEFAK
ncbi:histidine phosphatase family protein [Bacillus pinisoli]|uniref:histidine phosphatase family protein n=1 Tax=Bacillus pinisoli TaxID=2901866 RepID=UPI001FF33C32|nr:histidine phosphatase family protein [Bacillus pinisoli]